MSSIMREIKGRRLSAIEIAEGALLANIGLIFYLLSVYLPVVGTFFTTLVPIVFAVLVLRRGFYCGLIASLVALFLMLILSGFHFLFLLLLCTGAGLFLGVTMKYRLNQFLLIVLGVLGTSIGLWILLIVVNFIAGVPLSQLIAGVQRTYVQTRHSLDTLVPHLGLEQTWKSFVPHMDAVAAWTFANYLPGIFLGFCFSFTPVVIMVYFVTNVAVRRLGYQVRPFPGGRIERWYVNLVRRRMRKHQQRLERRGGS